MENPNKKVIVHLVNSNIYSGLEKVAIEIIESLNNDFEFYYACKDGTIENVLEEKNIKRIKIDKISKKEIFRIEKEYKPDIIHAHDYRATLFCGLFAKNAKVIAHLHNNSPWIKKYLHPYTYIFLKACKSNNVKKILTVSDSIEKEYVFSKYIKNKIEMIGNPVGIKNIINKVNIDVKKEYDICFTGRLTEQKNPIRFINIIKKIKQEFPNVKSVMIGDGELKDKCIQEIHKNGLEENIKIAGFLKNPYEEMVKAKIFCLTSDWEGYGLVAFEALTLGLPCIVSNVGGLSGIVTNECGSLCNSDEEFVVKISELMKDEKKQKQFSDNAKKRANYLDNFNSYMEKIRKIYES